MKKLIAAIVFAGALASAVPATSGPAIGPRLSRLENRTAKLCDRVLPPKKIDGGDGVTFFRAPLCAKIAAGIGG